MKQVKSVKNEQLSLMILQLIFMAYNNQSSKGGNYFSYYKTITNDQLEEMKQSIDGYLMGIIVCPFVGNLTQMLKRFNDRKKIIADKVVFEKKLHLEKGFDKQVPLEEILEFIKDPLFEVSKQGDQFLRKYAGYLLENTKEANDSLKLIIAYNSFANQHGIVYLPTNREAIKVIVDNAERKVKANLNYYEHYLKAPLSRIAFMEKLKNVYGNTGVDDLYASENEGWSLLHKDKRDVLCEIYRLYNGESIDFLQSMIDNGYSESVSLAYGDDFDYSFPDEVEMMRNYYLDYCITNKIAKGKMCLALVDSDFKFQTFNNKGRKQSCNDKVLKRLFLIFSEYCQFCDNAYLRYMFLGEGKGNAFRAIRWNGSIAFLRYAVLELNKVIFNGKRLDNGGWEAVCHNFVDAEDNPIPGTIKTASVRKKTEEMINFTAKLVGTGIKKAAPES